VYCRGGGKGSPQQWQKAMGIDWTHLQRELAEMLPPKYCEYIGKQYLSGLDTQLTIPYL
jgi:DNA (cytosine-5)-methyltransferase 1